MADGTIDIDLVLNKDKFTPDLESAKQLIHNFGNNAGDKMDESFKNNSSKVSNKAKETHEKVKTELGDTVTQKIKAQTEDVNSKVNHIKKEEESLKKPVRTKFKADFSNFNHNMGSAMDKVRDLKEQSGKIRGVFSGAFLGGIASNVAVSGFNAIKTAVTGVVGAGIEYNKQMQTMNATWTTLTGSSKKGKQMVKMTTDMAAAAANSVPMVQDLNSKLYAVTDNAERTGKLTKAMLTLQDAFGQSDASVQNFATQWSQMEANGKISAQDMMSFVNVFPKIRTELLKTMQQQTNNSSLTMKQMNDMMSAGKISSKTMDEVLINMQKKYKSATENFGSTSEGMVRTIKGRLPALIGEITEPFFKMSNPLFKSVSSWVSDPKTDDVFKQASKKVSNGMNNVMSAFSNQVGNTNMPNVLNGTVNKISKGLTDSLNWVADHAKSITGIFKSVGSIGSNLTIGYIDGLASLFKIFIGAKGDGVNAIADGLERIAKHKTAIQVIGGVLAGMWATSKITNYMLKIQSLIKLFKGLKTIALGTDLAKGAEGATASASKGGILSKILGSSKLSKVTSVGKSIGGKLVLGLNMAFDAFDIFKGITSKSKDERFTRTGKGIGGLIGTGIGAVFGGGVGATIGNIIGRMAGKWAGKATLNFSNGWNDWAKGFKPKGIIAKIGFNTHEAMHNWNNIIAKIEKKHPVIGFGIRALKSSIETEFDMVKDMFKVAFGIKSSIWDVVSNAFMGRFDKIIPALKKRWSNLFKGFKDDFENVKNTFTSDNSETRRGQKNTHASNKAVTTVGSNPMRNNNSSGGFNPNIDLGTAPRKTVKASPKTKAPKKNQGASTQKTIEKVASQKTVTSKDVANIKAMAKAIGGYDSAVKKLKKTVKKFPTLKIGNSKKQINKQISSIKKYDGQIKKSDKTMKKYSKTFSSLKKSLKSITKQFDSLEKFNKSLGKKDSFSKLNTDFKKLHKTLKKNDIVKDFKRLNTGLKKNDPSKRINKIDREIKKSTPIWRQFAKQVRVVNSAFKTLNTFSKRMSKSDPFSKLNRDFQRLSKTLKRENIGKELQEQVSLANKATKNSKFATQFDNSVNKIIRRLRSFKKTFNSDWRDVWNKANSDEKSKVGKLDSTFVDETNKVLNSESKFSSKFLDTWSSWLTSMKKSFRSAFNSLPGIASKDMGKVIAQINKGIGGVNTVIGAFGGKKLGLAQFAGGTSGYAGGLAVVGEQGYELAYDKRHGIYPVGTKGEEIRYLDQDTSIMPHSMSKQFMSMVAGLPHHANGKGDASNDMMDYLITHIDTIKKDPMPLLRKSFDKKAKFTGSLFERQFGPALENGLLKSISEPFKKELSDMDFSMGGNYDPKMIKAAALMMKVNPSDSFIKMLQSVIQSESGGRNIVQQIQDMNSGGNEARGILQYTPPTFSYYAVPGHTNIMNPFDQLLAFFNNSDWQSSIGPTSIWGTSKIDWLHSGPQGRPRFGNGGWSDKEAIFGEIPGEPEVAINPNRDSADQLIMEAIKKRVEKNPNGTMAKALKTIHNSRNQAHEFTGKSISNANASIGRGNVGINSNNLGNITVNTLLDNGVIVQGTYPLMKAMQAKEISIQSKKGGLH